MKKILFIFILFLFSLNFSFANNWCSWSIYKPFDRIILFDKFNASNSPKIINYELDSSYKTKLDNFFDKIPDDKKLEFLKNFEVSFKDRIKFYQQNIDSYLEWDKKKFYEKDILKIKLLYWLNFYFSDKYNYFESKLLKPIIKSEETFSLDLTELKVNKFINPNYNNLNCISIYDWFHELFESTDLSQDMEIDFKLYEWNIFYITKKFVWNKGLNKNLIKIYHLWKNRLTLQNPIYKNIVNIDDNEKIINDFIGDYLK